MAENIVGYPTPTPTSLENSSLTVTVYLVKGNSGALDQQKYSSRAFNLRILEYLHYTLHFK
jgi:hypothetical protein